MTDEELRAAARETWDVFNAHDLSNIENQVAADFTNANSIPGTPDGPEGMKQVDERLWSAFLDMSFDVGLINDHTAVRDDVSMLQQLGHMPAG